MDEEQTLTLNLSGLDLDRNKITYSASKLRTGAGFDPQPVILSCIPTLLQAGN